MAIKKTPLLGELEDLQAVLVDTAGIDPASIPILDDIIESAPDTYDGNNSGEMRISDTGVEFTAPTPSQNANRHHDDDFGREIFIQDLIDAMMPGIEAELRKRLLNLDQDILERWYQQDHP